MKNKTVFPLVKTSSSTDQYPLSFAQMRVWLDQQINPTTLFYNISHIYEINGDLNISILHQSLNRIVARHEILRTIFYEHNGEPVQQVLPSSSLPLPFVDLSTNEARDDQCQRMIDQEMRRPFNLSTEWPIRVRLIQTAPQQYIFILVMHHIAGDHWSTSILYKELSTIYGALLQGREIELKPLLIQYRDFAVWEHNISNPEPKADRDFWLDQLKGDLQVLNLPFDKVRPLRQTFNGSIERRSLEAETWQAIKAQCERWHVTPFMLLIGAYAVFLSRLTGQKDILIGTFLANRQRKELAPLIGILFNNLPIRILLEEDDQTFSNLVERVRDTLLDAFDHMNFSYDELIQQLNLPRIGARPMLYNTSFQLYYKRGEETLDLHGVNISQRRVVDDVLYDLMGYAQEKGSSLQLWFNYNRDVFEASTIRRFLVYFHSLLTCIARNPDLLISEMEMLPASEKRDLLENFNASAKPYPRESTIAEVFQAQVERAPQHPALIDPLKPEKSLSFSELNRRANQVAHYLLRKGLRPGQVVGILLERSVELFIAYLGVLKAGGVCLTLDGGLPRERIRYMTRDARARWVVTAGNMVSRKDLHTDIVQLDIFCDEILSEDNKNPDVQGNGEESAAIIYTSGSTGRPKGVELLQRGLINQAFHRIHILNIAQTDTTCLSLSTSFVTMPLQFFSTLFCGAALLILPSEVVNDPRHLFNQVRTWEISSVEVTVSGLKAFLDVADHQDLLLLPNLHTVLVAGEKLTAEVAAAFYRRYPNIVLFNAYGQTECSGMTLCMPVPQAASYSHVIEGYPTQNNQVYVLDEKLDLVPYGVKGEICISGDGVSKGYVRKPLVTKEKFIAHPFKPGNILYRTGDFGRRWPDGTIEVLGRLDDLVKIRGYRVEPSEIAVVLQQHPLIKRVYVTAFEEKERILLVAYFTTHNGSAVDPRLLISFLSQSLPAYMIPAVFEHIDKFPLNSNGKLDKKALPKPSRRARQALSAHAQPVSPLEQAIMNIWQEVLDVAEINVEDHFLDLGGHSLNALQIASRIGQRYNLNLATTTVFDYPTVKELASHIGYLIGNKKIG